jgi:hypothetical protein
MRQCPSTWGNLLSPGAGSLLLAVACVLTSCATPVLVLRKQRPTWRAYGRAPNPVLRREIVKARHPPAYWSRDAEVTPAISTESE